MWKMISLIWSSDDEEEVFCITIGSECCFETLTRGGFRIFYDRDAVLFSDFLEAVWESPYRCEVNLCPFRAYVHFIGHESTPEDVHRVMCSGELCLREFVFFSPSDDDILTITPISIFFVSRESEYTSVPQWRNIKSILIPKFEYLRRDDCLFCRVSYESHLRIIVILEVSMPVEMVRFDVSIETIVSRKWLDPIWHKTRYFDDDISPFFSLLEDLTDCLRKWCIKIPRKIDTFFARKLFFEYTIEDPGCRRLPICPCDRASDEVIWKVCMSKIKLRNHLSSRVDRMRRSNPRRWDDLSVLIIWLRRITIISDLIWEPEMATESSDSISYFSFTVD